MNIKQNICRIYGRKGYYTENYCMANNIPYTTRYREAETYCHVPYISSRDSVMVHDVEGCRTAYLFGEKTFFWTESERDEYRKKRNQDLALAHAKTQVLDTVKARMANMTIEEVEKYLEKIEKGA